MKKITLHIILICAAFLTLPVYAQQSGDEDPDFTKLIQPIPLTSNFKQAGYYVWCGTMVKGADNKYHLYYSRWKKEFGFMAWVTHSEVAHAVADSPMGPYKFHDLALAPRGEKFWDGHCTHNPTVHRFGNKYYIYYMGNRGDGKNIKNGLNWTHRNNQRIGVAVSKSPNGPWVRSDKPLIDVSPDSTAHDALATNNPSVLQKADGTYLMVYKAVARRKPLPFGGPVVHMVATSKKPTGPWVKQPKPVFTATATTFAAEDPFIWREGNRYFAIVKDMGGHFTGAGRSLAMFTSNDGINWAASKNILVSTLNLKMADGTTKKFEHVERPQLYIENGKPRALFVAVDGDAEFPGETYNIQIPLK
jgi:predicted GH43/DUF377 family glycosyl hydrolase